MALAPSRTDWRWEQAAAATDYADSQALHLLAPADALTHRAYLFKRAVDNNLDGGRWPDVAAAHELWANRPQEKLFVEGMLLGNQSFDLIAHEVGADVEDITAYHELFFDVIDKLNKPGWLVARLFTGGLYAPMSSRDRVGVMHRVAWLAGPDVFRSYYTGVYDESIKNKLGERIRDMLAKQSLLSAMCIGGRGDLDIEVIRVFVDDTKKQAVDTIAGGDKAMSDAVMGFMGSFGEHMTVADPTVLSNLQLPAREPRAADYLVHKP